MKALFLILLFVFLVGCSKEGQQVLTSLEPAQPAYFSLEEIVNHNSEDDCWVIIEDKVYDVSDFISGHPGGKAILEGCGKESTDLFETRPMGSGTPHSNRARSIRESYFIGEVE